MKPFPLFYLLILCLFCPLLWGQDKKGPSPELENLLGQISQGGPEDRALAMIKLAKFKEKASPAIPKLIKFFYESDPLIQGNAIDTLSQIGKAAVPPLLGALGNPNPKVQECAAVALGKIGKVALPYLGLALKGQDKFLKKYAVKALGHMKEEGLSFLPNLLELIKKGDLDLQCEIVLSIGNMGPGAATAVPVLLTFLDHPQVRLRASAIGALMMLDKVSRDPLLDKLRDKNPLVRQSAAAALGGMGERALDSLLPLLKDKDWKAREGAAMAIGWMRDKGAPAIPELINNLQDRDRAVRKVSGLALGSIGPLALAPLVKALEREDPLLKEEASFSLSILRDFGKVEKKTLNQIFSHLWYPNPKVRGNVARALARIGPPALPLLEKSLKGRDDAVRDYAVFALGEMGDKGTPAFPSLLESLKDKSPAVRETTVEALVKMGEKILPQLQKAIKNKDGRVRYGVVAVFRKMGLGAKAALPVLMDALKDPDPKVWKEAREAIKNIQKEEKEKEKKEAEEKK